MGYVKQGYVQAGYFVDDKTVYQEGTVVLKHFILKDESSLKDAVSSIQSLLQDGEVGILYSPLSKKFYYIDKKWYEVFAGDSITREDVHNIVSQDTELIQQIVNESLQQLLSKVSVGAKLIANNATIITPAIEHNGTEFSFTVPEELSGLQYKVLINITTYE